MAECISALDAKGLPQPNVDLWSNVGNYYWMDSDCTVPAVNSKVYCSNIDAITGATNAFLYSDGYKIIIDTSQSSVYTMNLDYKIEYGLSQSKTANLI